jgi:hypothetical protein
MEGRAGISDGLVEIYRSGADGEFGGLRCFVEVESSEGSK